MKRKILALVCVFGLTGSLSAEAETFLSFFSKESKDAGDITSLAFSSANRCFTGRISLVEDGMTDIADLTPEEQDPLLRAAGITKPGAYKFRFGQDDFGESSAKNLTNAKEKKGLSRNPNKGSKKGTLSFKVKKSGDLLFIQKQTGSIVCVTDTGLEAGSIPVSFFARNKKAQKVFGAISTVFSISVES